MTGNEKSKITAADAKIVISQLTDVIETVMGSPGLSEMGGGAATVA